VSAQDSRLDDPLVIGVVAGEASGDLLGGHLLAALRQRLPQVEFVGIAGPRMQGYGANSLFLMNKLSVRGYVEVLRHYFEIVGIRRDLGNYFLLHRPALFIGIDAPDFNLDLELRLKTAGIPTVHYVGPSIWAWRRGRLHKIRRAVSKMLTLFPFEAALYEDAGVAVEYVGHPLADLLAVLPDARRIRGELGLPEGDTVIALLPGSRLSELKSMADLFVATAALIGARLANARFVVPLVDDQTTVLFQQALDRHGGIPRLMLLRGQSHEAMVAADAVVVASGTATLEAALLKRPMVITYRMPRLSWWIMNRLKYVNHVGLPNILAGEPIVPELLQDDATPGNLADAVLALLHDEAGRKKLDAHFERIRVMLRRNTADRAADAILAMLPPGCR